MPLAALLTAILALATVTTQVSVGTDGDVVGDACDLQALPPPDLPGVTVGSWDRSDPDGDSHLDTVTTFRAQHFNIAGTVIGSGDHDWHGITWAGGDLQLQLIGLSNDLEHRIGRDRGMAWHGPVGRSVATMMRAGSSICRRLAVQRLSSEASRLAMQVTIRFGEKFCRR